MFHKSILLRRGIRSDKIWGNSLLFREPFRRIPFYLDTYALNKSQYWPREEIKKLGLERFAETVKRASVIPFWKERFAQVGVSPNNFCESDIVRIPILTKKDFQDRNVSEYTVPELIPKSRKYSTSGSTGRPLNVYRDPQFELRSSAIEERMFRAVGDGERFPVILMRNGPHMGFDYTKYHFFFLQGYNSIRHRIRELEKFLSSFPEEVILYSLGSSLLELARVCRDLQISLPLRCVVSVAEELRDSQKMEISNILRVCVRTVYSAKEVRQLAFECEHRRLHITEESIYFEITDDNGTQLPSGTRGRIVVTGFENRVMPFIRYDTGDIGIIREDPCPCGRTLRTLEFQGRQVQLLHVGGDRTISLMDFFFLFDEYFNSIRQFQIVRTGECTFTMRIVPGLLFDEERIKRELTFKFRIHPHVQVEWEIVDFIPEGPNGKAVYFVDKFESNS